MIYYQKVPSPLAGEGKGEGDAIIVFNTLSLILSHQGRGTC